MEEPFDDQIWADHRAECTSAPAGISQQERGALSVPDILHLLPEGRQKMLIFYCLDTLGLSLDESYKALLAAGRALDAIDVLLSVGRAH
ncbi:MAG: hypothetical protein ACRDF4_07770 [Rhabdochlamydiaceae bacterium]